MATLIDEERLEDNNEEYTSLEEVQEEQVEEVPEEPTPEPEDDLPEKYRGKSAAEIAKMHQEAEKALGRQGGEVGELRKIVDDFVKAQLDTRTAPVQQEEVIEEDDWYLNPEKAVEKAISNHPKLKQAEAMSLQMQQAQAVEALKAQHPDFAQIVADEKFQQWVKASKIRQQLLVQADQAYDVDAANELLGTWKERTGAVNEVATQEKAKRKEQVKAASTGNAHGSGEAPSRKIYRRADIIKLMQTDPDRYMQMADEIAQAYAEKRVK
jgi:hypothetical protein